VNKFLVFALALLLASCQTEKQAYYKNSPVKVLSERCDETYPHHCRSKVQRESGAQFEVDTTELEYR
jgi:starvation-inducible outer membrane lipoprotein